MYTVEMQNVSCGYEGRVPVVRDVSLRVTPGSFVGMVGPSGAGKTTLLKTILGMTPSVTGMVRVGAASQVGPNNPPTASAMCRRSKRSIGPFRSRSKMS